MIHCWLGDKLHISKSCIFFFVVLLLFVPIRWILAGFLSAFIHELCHILAVKMMGKEIFGIELGVFGAQISTESMRGWREFICLAAGPAGSLLLILLFRWLPITALFGFAHGVFNLLPIIPLDGGRMLACMLACHMDKHSVENILNWIEFCVYLLAAMLSFAFFINLKRGIWPVLILFTLLIRKILRKIPCKLLNLGVQ